MNWTYVEAECNCPHETGKWRIYLDSDGQYSLENAKKEVLRALDAHQEESPCKTEHATMNVHYHEVEEVEI